MSMLPLVTGVVLPVGSWQVAESTKVSSSNKSPELASVASNKTKVPLSPGTLIFATLPTKFAMLSPSAAIRRQLTFPWANWSPKLSGRVDGVLYEPIQCRRDPSGMSFSYVVRYRTIPTQHPLFGQFPEPVFSETKRFLKRMLQWAALASTSIPL